MIPSRPLILHHHSRPMEIHTMPATTEGIRQTYDDVQRLIHHTVNRFRRRNGGDRDELLSVANERFVAAYRKYDVRRKTRFTTWVSNSIWYGLQTHQRREHPLRKGKRIDLTLELLPERKLTDRLEELVSGLSEDAQFVTKLAINPPEEVRLVARCGRGENTPDGLRRGIRLYLREIGWDAERIELAFEEVRESLQ